MCAPESPRVLPGVVEVVVEGGWLWLMKAGWRDDGVQQQLRLGTLMSSRVQLRYVHLPPPPVHHCTTNLQGKHPMARPSRKIHLLALIGPSCPSQWWPPTSPQRLLSGQPTGLWGLLPLPHRLIYSAVAYGVFQKLDDRQDITYLTRRATPSRLPNIRQFQVGSK